MFDRETNITRYQHNVLEFVLANQQRNLFFCQNEDDRQAYDANDDHYYEDRSIDDDKKSLMECEEVVNAQFRNAELEQVIDREKQLRQSFNPMPFSSATDWLTVSS